MVANATMARAQPGNTPPGGAPPPPSVYVPPTVGTAPTRTERYGTKIATVDALAGGLVMVGALVLVAGFAASYDDSEGGGSDGEGTFLLGLGMMIGGVGVYAFGPAYVHVKHDNSSSAWKSVALRLGLPALGGMIGEAMSRTTCDAQGYCYENNDGAGGALSSLGIVAAMVIDWTVLAKHQVPQTPPSYYPYAAPVATGRGGTLGIAGAF